MNRVGVLPNVPKPLVLKQSRNQRWSAIDCLDLALDKFDHSGFQRHVIECIDFLNASRAGNIDFRQKSADYIQSHEVLPVRSKQRRKRRADFAVTIG